MWGNVQETVKFVTLKSAEFFSKCIEELLDMYQQVIANKREYLI